MSLVQPRPAAAPRLFGARIDGPTLGIWGLIALFALALALAYPLTGLTLAPGDIVKCAAFSAFCLALSAFYTVKRPDARIARLFRAVPEFTLITFLSGALSYAAAAAGMPLWDTTFDAWDKAIGFDWPRTLAFHLAHSWLFPVLSLAYSSMLPQMAILPVALVTARAFGEADRFMLAFGFAALVTVAVSALMPALSAGHFYGEATAAPAALRSAWSWVPQIVALRAGDLTFVSMASAEGLVSMPSFHTVLAILFMIGFWHLPWLRWPAVVLNLALIAATPIVGGHYLVDLIGGVVVALLARAFALRVAPAG